MIFIDTSFLQIPDPEKPGETRNGNGWGYMNPHDPQMVGIFQQINEIAGPKNVLEIGMFCGHSALIMLNTFTNIETLTSLDPNRNSIINAPAIKERYPHFSHLAMKIHECSPTHSFDFIFVDGRHEYNAVVRDIEHSLKLDPTYLLFDNVELEDVRRGMKHFGYFDKARDPKYFFYVNEHKGRVQPGILQLVKVK
jgi:predicted O-methyltransferase YrrM